jgi:hypothetical protein
MNTPGDWLLITSMVREKVQTNRTCRDIESDCHKRDNYREYDTSGNKYQIWAFSLPRVKIEILQTQYFAINTLNDLRES